MDNPKEIVEKLYAKLKECKINDPQLRQTIIIFTLQEKAIAVEEAIAEYKKNKGSYKSYYYEYVDTLKSALYYCIKNPFTPNN